MTRTKSSAKIINLALQGGGSHGAFTWGVLDRLLDSGKIRLDGISGTSAGAVNAVALAHGFATALDAGRDPFEGARESLANVWEKVIQMGTWSAVPSRIAELMMGFLPSAMTQVSPYQANPLNLNPLRDMLAREIDFERLQSLESPNVYVCATCVEDGRAEVFTGKRLTVDAVMASACLPTLFQAPVIDGKHYWDGGYSANPSFAPLIDRCCSTDILLIQINPLRIEHEIRSADEITDRMNELTFNASLITQLRTIELVNELIQRGVAQPGMKLLHLHRIDGGRRMRAFPPSTKGQVRRAMMEELAEIGRFAAGRWLRRCFGAVGTRSTIDIAYDYGNPLTLDYGLQEFDDDDDDDDIVEPARNGGERKASGESS